MKVFKFGGASVKDEAERAQRGERASATSRTTTW